MSCEYFFSFCSPSVTRIFFCHAVKLGVFVLYLFSELKSSLLYKPNSLYSDFGIVWPEQLLTNWKCTVIILFGGDRNWNKVADSNAKNLPHHISMCCIVWTG